MGSGSAFTATVPATDRHRRWFAPSLDQTDAVLLLVAAEVEHPFGEPALLPGRLHIHRVLDRVVVEQAGRILQFELDVPRDDVPDLHLDWLRPVVPDLFLLLLKFVPPDDRRHALPLVKDKAAALNVQNAPLVDNLVVGPDVQFNLLLDGDVLGRLRRVVREPVLGALPEDADDTVGKGRIAEFVFLVIREDEEPDRAHAKALAAGWKNEYNHRRPHSSLGYRTPASYAATLAGPAVGAAPLPPARQAEEPAEALTLITAGT